MKAKFEELCTRLGEIADLNTAAAILSWDQQTYMPPGSAVMRAATMATLRKTAHEWFTADETGQFLQDLAPWAEEQEYGSFEASLVRVTRHRYERMRKVPSDLVARLTRARAIGHAVWEKARPANDFALFQPNLEEIVDLNIEMAEALGYEDRRYDALLDGYERDMKASEVQRLFDEMKVGLLPLVEAIAERKGAVDVSVLRREYDEQKQWEFGVEIVKRLGYDFEHGRQDRAAHPFTTSFTPADVRITTRIHRDQVGSGLFATIHEGGHAMYEQGVSMDLARTPLAGGASLGLHESQSRMWENMVGRSREFWTFWLPRMKEYFPAQLDGVTVDEIYRASNYVEPSLIRVEADEVTYNMHIFLRFEVENLMLDQKVPIRDLPELWNQKMVEYLGIHPDSDTNGVLQDVHWAGGMLGYFPTYSLGNLLAAQFYAQALSEMPDLPQQFERGEFSGLLGWLRTNIHVHGSKYTPVELVERITGGPIRTEPFLDYVREKYTQIYDL
ncbi:MAG: carboxypeptidase M32 [Anaerolineae bacterium]|nr:carboxypeptidase M32 [Anaerolineae bacterium]